MQIRLNIQRGGIKEECPVGKTICLSLPVHDEGYIVTEELKYSSGRTDLSIHFQSSRPITSE